VNIESITFERLTRTQIDAWSEIQRAEPMLASPYFRPEFTEAVSSVRGNVEIAVIKDGVHPVAFLPFQRSKWNAGYPVGGKLSDFHGVIAPANFQCEPLEVLRVCGLASWKFNHAISAQQIFSAFVEREVESPYIDLSSGMSAYLAKRKNSRRIRRQYGQKLRKLAREVGPIRFEPRVDDRALIATLLTWKTHNLRRMRVPNILAYTWVRGLLETILNYSSSNFSALVSVLYAGDTIAAIDFGIRSGPVLHSWFPTYNPELARYSPGFLCRIETMKAAESLGIRRIDLGSGSESFKYRLMSDVTKVAEGTADRKFATSAMRRAWWSARSLVRLSPLSSPARKVAQNVRRARHWLDVKIANQRRFTS
jgi:CelD/BcsL family acetyltransferase involved in cellulose biosynthesis